jgi:Protein of unknown function (DUF1549)/Protein of unknown function (DUF1553)
MSRPGSAGRRRAFFAAAIAAAGVYAFTPSRAEEPLEAKVADSAHALYSECTYFGPERERFTPRPKSAGFTAGSLTRQFQAASAANRGAARAGRKKPFDLAGQTGKANLIDQYIWVDLQANNITPADKTTDYEFVRRVTLDLTGRIPTSARVRNFVASADPAKRGALIDELLATPEWVDKWTMFFGDLYRNTATTVQVQLRPEGRNAFYKWIHDSVAANKPYNRMASELIAAEGTNSFDQTNGQVNYLALGVVTGGPQQDIFDQQTSNIAANFLGIAHVNCLLCHNGRGHLDSLSLWGSGTTRVQAWGLSAFMAHTWTRRLVLPPNPDGAGPANYNYWSLDQYKTDYALNTTTGNRPARQPVGTLRAVTPAYVFTGDKPGGGEDYRVALARLITGDFQFARAAVNYVWAQFFGAGIVDPPDQFDPARLDPDNPPPDPWTLQPTNPRLLNALAQSFIDSGYDLKALIRLIANSDTYQLASEYNGAWEPAWDKYFGRKFVRRLWAEEVHDSVVTAINTLPTYTVPGFSNDSAVYGANSPGFGKISFAMQAPDVVNMPDGGAVSQFLDTFLRGNRDDQLRKGEGSILQTLGLMNDNFIESRIHAGTPYLAKLLTASDDALIDTMFLDVLSRHPSADELAIARAQMAAGATAAQRKANAEDLLWTLFNKVDFVFNY